MSKITSSSAGYQNFPTLFELESVAGFEDAGDSHFCSHDFMDWATDRQDGIHFITGLAGNVKFQKMSARSIRSCTRPVPGSISKGLWSKSKSTVSEQTSGMS